MPRTSPRKRRTWMVAGGGVAALVVGVAFVFSRSALASGDTGGNYRTAVATQSAVVESLQRTGTIEPISQASVAFPIAGRIASVSVHTGQAVATGDVLAALDTTTLQSQLAQKKAALAQAQLTLEQAVTAADTAAANRAAAAAATTTTTTSPPPTPATAAPGRATASVDAVSDVTKSQQDVDASMARAKDSLQFAISACSDASSGSQPCLSAQQAALSDQETVAAAQKNLAAAETALATSLQSAGTATSPVTPSRATPAARSTSTATPAAAPVISPEQLVADQAAVDAAQANIAVVEQNLAQATIVSPIAGTVEAVNLTPGASVSAGSGTATVVIVGAGGFEVATTVDVNDLPKLKVGNPATVTPDGGADKIAGQVVAIGVLPTTSGTATTYPVVIGLNSPSTALHAGASAAVSIDVASTATATTVPTSAVRSAGNLHFVRVLTNGKTVTTPVQTGTVGSERTEIVSGLTAGQVVVVADLSQPLPSSNTSSRFGGGLGGGLGGLGGAGGVRVARGG